MGSRHLQAIMKLENVTHIEIVEPNIQSRDLGASRMEEVRQISGLDRYPSVEFLSDISELSKGTPELTIIATQAPGRAKVIKSLLKKGHRTFLIEKMVCQSNREYLSIIKSLKENNARAWVNCPRRYFPFYKEISQRIQGEAPVSLNVAAGNLGLGCNVLHFLDLLIFFTGEKDLELSGGHLFPEIFPNPRGQDLLEFAGTLTASSAGGFASVTFHPGNDAPPVIDIITAKNRIWIDEWAQKARMAAKENGWKWEDREFQVLYTSVLTTEISRSIIGEGQCLLPSIEDLYPVHKELFRIFEKHAGKLTGKKFTYCPIT